MGGLADILICDDEPSNVKALEVCLRKSSIKFVTTTSLDEAAGRICHRINHPFKFLVFDNHFCDESGLYASGLIYGVDFLNIIQGRTELFGDEHYRFIDDYFGDKFSRIVSAYSDCVMVIFSGSAAGDSINRPDLYAGIEIVVKRPDSSFSVPCEQDVVDVFEDNCFSVRYFDFARYKRNSGLCDGVN